MGTLVFDIETIGVAWDSLDNTTQKSLTKWIHRTSVNEQEKEVRVKNLKNELGFSPLTGKIVALGVYDVERELGAVYVQGSGLPDVLHEGFAVKFCSEKEMLEDFWESAKSYDVFVTFSGRSFDVPFILHRSVANEVEPTVELMRKRYLSQQSEPYHIDLQDELTFYGAMMKRPSLHMFCQAYGIESPKECTDGDEVASLYRSGKFLEIAKYNAGDLRAAVELYKKWFRYIAPSSFKHRII